MKQFTTSLLFITVIISLAITKAFSQDAAPISGNAMAASNFENTPINYYSGMPSISIPLFNYSQQNGLSLNMSLDYASGGIPVNSMPTTAGLGWAVNVGGSVVRTVRGLPDDFRKHGYIYAESVPTDYKEQAAKFYHDSLDAEQDIFQFNINGRSGKFLIGKNKQIVLIPLSKLRITYTTSPVDSSITAFYITTEQGIKYSFNELEKQQSEYGIYTDSTYTSVWDLSSIVAPFSTDSIKFIYRGSTQTTPVSTQYTGYIVEGDTTMSRHEEWSGYQSVITKKISIISFPDKKLVKFVYDPFIRYDKHDFALNSIHIGDSVFRYGYKFDLDTLHRTFLTGVYSYTNKYINPGYKFTYNLPYLADFGTTADTLGNKRDHWGFYNAASNDTSMLPLIPGIFHGTDRTPNEHAIASSLAIITDPSGGKTYYSYENNDVYRPFNTIPQYLHIDCTVDTVYDITLSHGTNTTDSFTFSPSLVARDTLHIYDDTTAIIWSLTNADSSVIYASDTLNLGLMSIFNSPVSFTVNNLANGNYKLHTVLIRVLSYSARTYLDTTVGKQRYLLTLSWLNQKATNENKTKVGGIRIKQISHYDPVSGKTDIISSYKYILPNGRSSGFLGVTPNYYHPYRETTLSPSNPLQTVSNYLLVSGDPVSGMCNTQGSPVGYSRVEVIKGSLTKNLGKQVYEFSTMQDAGSAVNPLIFPYAPSIQRDWAIGLNKKVSVFDSTGRLIQQTVNTYNTITQSYSDSNFRSLKLGLTGVIFHSSAPPDENFSGQYYFPESGRADLVSTTETFYHTDNSTQTKTQTVEYDSNYNPVKMTSGYDQSRGLSLERRMYYPYNYTIGGTIGALRDSGIYTVVASEDWITGDSIPRMLSANITEFQQLTTGFIKPLGTYALQTKKPVPLATIDTFDAAHLVRNTTYFKKQQEFAAYDSSGNCVDMRNAISGQGNAIIMDYQNRFPIAKISNAKFTDVAYTSFEADGTGNWSIASTLRFDSNAITGKKCYSLANGIITKAGLDNSITYIISYWKYNTATVTVSNAADVKLIAEQGNWKLYTQTISSVDSVSISGSGLIDELRLYPKDANMATSTYEPLIGVTSTCDANNTISYYEYDGANRLIVLRDKDRYVVKKYEYSDSLITRNLTSPVKTYERGLVWNPATGTHEFRCYWFWKYSDGIMGDENIEMDFSNCPRNPRAGAGLVAD
ncbi:MAG: hypothetical protein QM737_15980 [Ferruginibacter sp.]